MPKYKVEKAYFRGSKSYGRTTVVTDPYSGRTIVFMGDIPKSEAIRNFEKQIRKGK